MLCEKILGRVTDPQFDEYKIDYVEIEWHESYNKILRKTSKNGKDVAIRLDDEILKIGMKPGDVLGIDSDGTIFVVDILATEVLVATIENPNPFSVAKTAYEIGNCHAPLFAGEKDNELVTIFNEPMEHLLSHLHHLGVKVERKIQKLDFTKQISSIVGHSHHHH